MSAVSRHGEEAKRFSGNGFRAGRNTGARSVADASSPAGAGGRPIPAAAAPAGGRIIRTVRPALNVLLVALAVLVPATLHAAPEGAPPDTGGILTTWRVVPPQPCVLDSVSMLVRGYVATPCDSFVGAEAITPLFVRIRQVQRIERQCFAAPSIFYEVPLPLGRFIAGTHSGIVEVATTLLREDGTSTLMTQQFRFGFEVAAECSIPPPPPPPTDTLPYVQTIRTEPPRACAGQPTSLVLEGAFPTSCGQVVDTYVQDSQNVYLTLRPFSLPDTACLAVLKPWRADFPLGPLPTGPHRTNITMVVYQRDSVGGGIVPNFYYGSHEFFVYGDCDSIPPPPGPLPYVNRIVVGTGETCGQDGVCPGDSILVQVGGVFPNDCLRFRRIQLIPSPATVVPPPPPTVRIIVDDNGCQRRPCSDVQVPWFTTVFIPAMSPGAYELPVELAQVSCSDTYPPGQLFHTTVPLIVPTECPDPPPPCLAVNFAPGSPVACNATVGFGRPAELTFAVSPTVALAGLQGEFRLDPPTLRVTGIEAIGPAQGMLLDWTATPDGARFVLFAQSGAPIPPVTVRNMRDPATLEWPVLKVTAEFLNRGGLPPERTVVTTDNILGSDIDGGAVRLCPPPPCVDLLYVQPRAIICAEGGCDYNADGLQDVRDLVLMVHCANGEGCPPDSTADFDCNADGVFAIADVLCCARHVLQRPPCPECPPDTGQVRPAPDVSVSFGTPEQTATGLVLPVDIAGIGQLGAAMLTLEAPLDRYDVVGFDVNPPGDWLALHEVRDGRIVLGMIGVTAARQIEQRASSRFTLTLALRPGQTAGGALTAVAGEFSGPDGVALGVNLGRPSLTLPDASQIALGANRPNPFSSETAFSLDLVETADVVVGIYDIRGRSVANLHRAPLGPGPHEFKWNGRGTDGSAAPNGVYFYQVTVGGKSYARKLILMRGK